MKKNLTRALAAITGAALSISMVMCCGCSAKMTEAEDTSNQLAYYGAYGMTESGDEYYSAPAYDIPEWNTEEYARFEENAFKSVALSPFSTFSADVDTSSYSLIRRKINEGKLPETSAVRIEEMLNYFKYDYPQPTGDEPFSVTTEIAPCPWNEDTELMLIGLQAQAVDTTDMPDNNLVFLIDVSGSMDEPDKLPLVKQAFSLLVEQLDDNDRISIVTYASGDSVVLEGAKGSDSQEILDAINSLEPYGSTYGSKGIQTAYEIANENFIKGGNNRIILATDGDLNVGVTDSGQLKKLVEKQRKNGVNLSVLGFGAGNIKDDKMETLADNGNGSYHYIDSVSEARRVLVEEMGGTLLTVAKDVKLQVQFNPAQIKGYRLIGYEDRLLNDEDFDNDEKDAGDIGAGHRVTALYEIVKTDSPMEVYSPDLKYVSYTDAGKGSDDYCTLALRYKNPDADKSDLLEYTITPANERKDLSDNMKLAAAVTETGMLLRESKFAGTSSYEGALELLDSIGNMRDDEYKAEFYEMIEKIIELS